MSRLLLVLLVLPVIFLLSWLATSLFNPLEERLSEARWAAFPDTKPEQRFVVLTIDEAALEQLGAWPWQRSTLAAISAKLKASGAALQLYDILLPEAKKGDAQLAQQLAQTPSVLGILPVLQGNQNLQTGNLGQSAILQGAILQGAILQGTQSPSGIHCKATASPLPHTRSYLGNAPAFALQNQGHLAPLVDTDGVIRKQPPLVCINNQAYPSLTLAALLVAEQVAEQTAPQLILEKGQGLFAPDWWLKTASGSALPLDKQGNLRLSYHQAPESFTTLSVADLMNENFAPELLNNTWVIMGATAFGLADVVPTPHAALTSGVELQARFLSALLDNNHVYQPQGAVFAQLLQMLLSAGLLLLLAAQRQHNVTLLAAAAFMLPVAHLGIHWLLLPHNLWLGWLAPALYSSLAALALLLLEFSRTRFERQRLYQNLSSYLPKGIADQIAFRKTSSQVEGSNQPLLVIYADLRNFSAWQEHLPAEETAALLHYFFVTANQTLAEHGGTLHEFRGDALLGAWPLLKSTASNQNTASNKATASNQNTGYKNSTEQMHKAIAVVEQLQTRLKSLLEAPPSPHLEPLALDFALDSGPVLIGSIGSAQRRSHLLLGQTISRVIGIQKMTAEIGSTLLIGEHAAQSLPKDALQTQGSYLLEGSNRPQQLFTLKPPPFVAKAHANPTQTNRVLQLHTQSR